MRPQEVSEFLAWHALLEREGTGEFGRFERPNTLEAPGEVVDQRFSEQDVPDEKIDPRLRAPGEGILDGVKDLPGPLLASSPGVGAEPSLLGQGGCDALQVRAVDRRVDQALQTDVLIGPQAPARPVLSVDLELVCQQAVAASIALGITGVDG